MFIRFHPLFRRPFRWEEKETWRKTLSDVVDHNFIQFRALSELPFSESLRLVIKTIWSLSVWGFGNEQLNENPRKRFIYDGEARNNIFSGPRDKFRRLNLHCASALVSSGQQGVHRFFVLRYSNFWIRKASQNIFITQWPNYCERVKSS